MLRISLDRWLMWLTGVLTLLLIIRPIYQHPILLYILGVAAWFLLAATFTRVKSYGKWVALLLSVGGIATFLWNGGGWKEILSSVTTNVSMVGIFLSVPLIGFAIRSGGYLQAIHHKTMLIRKKGNARPYLTSSLITCLLGPFLNVGALYIVRDISYQALGGFYSKKMAVNLYRSFSSILYWSPFSVVILLTMNTFHIKWSEWIWYLLGGALCHIVLQFVLFRFIKVPQDIWIEREARDQIIDEKKVNRKIFSLILIMAGLLVLTVSLEIGTSLPMTSVILYVSIIYSFVWMICLGKTLRFIARLRTYARYVFNHIKTEMMLMLSAGVFASAVATSDFNTEIGKFLSIVVNWPQIFFIVILFLVFVASGLVGIHAVVLITILGAAISSHTYFDHPFFVPTLILFATILQGQVTPIGIIVAVISNQFKIDISTLLRKNVLVLILLAAFLIGILMLM